LSRQPSFAVRPDADFFGQAVQLDDCVHAEIFHPPAGQRALAAAFPKTLV
jgi:hypothetical protein